MRLLIGLILFWLSTFGYVALLTKKTKLPYELALPIIFSLTGILMFLSGLLNVMQEASLLTCLSGIGILIYYIVKRKIKFEKKININVAIIFTILLYFTIICSNMHIIHYDNFSHWGLIVKTMFIENFLPNFQNQIIEFRDYQPGSACFIYYFSFLAGKTEGNMIIAQNYLLAAYFFSLLIFTKDKKKENYLLKILIISCYLFVMIGNIVFNDLLVDTLIAVISICCFSIFYYYRDNLKNAFLYALPLSIYLFLVKNTGIILVGFNCLILLYLGIKNKKFKKSLIYAIFTGIISIIFFYIWSKHVSYVYGHISLYSKHALSSSNIISELRTKGMVKIIEFIKIYINHFFNIKNNLPNKYIIGINIIFLSFLAFFKKQKKTIVSFMVLSDIMYLLYYGILGIMYLLSMPWDEAKNLASFDRYMLTIIFMIIGAVIICFCSIIKENKNKYLYVFAPVFIVLVMYLNFYKFHDYKIFYGNQNYEKTTAYKFDKILKTPNYISNSNDFYFVYAPETSNNDYGYTHYLSRYKLFTENEIIVKEVNVIDENINYDNNNIIIILDEDNKIIEYLNTHDYVKDGKGMYKKINSLGK